MNRKLIIPVFVCMIFASVLFPFCDFPDLPQQQEPNRINLIWYKSYEGQTKEDIRRGFIWALSWLGAELPKGSFDSACVWSDSTRFTINLDSVGFNANARSALLFICDSIRRSAEYKASNGIEIGKFVMLTLGSSWHYYKITGAPANLADFRTFHGIDAQSNVYGITNSGISKGNRRIYFSRDTSLMHIGFVGEEGGGSLNDHSFHPTEYECFDLMPNGQLRFVIYDSRGDLIPGTPMEIGKAGKPAKCLWCHETVIQPLFIDNAEVNGMLTNREFKTMRDSIQDRLERYRLTLNSDMDWKNQKTHTLGELLYITYMEPTLLHMSNEWNVTADSAVYALRRAGVYHFDEFDYIGSVYPRAEVNQLDHIFHLKVPESARETGQEVNYWQ